MFSAEVARACHRAGAYFSIENPTTSALWSFEPIASLAAMSNVYTFTFDQCRYGVPHKMTTKIMTNFQALSVLSMKCNHLQPHSVLQGTHKVVRPDGTTRWESRTATAGAYPPLLCKQWAAAASGGLPTPDRERAQQRVARWEAQLREVRPPKCHAAHALHGDEGGAEYSQRAAKLIHTKGLRFARKGRGLDLGLCRLPA